MSAVEFYAPLLEPVAALGGFGLACLVGVLVGVWWR